MIIHGSTDQLRSRVGLDASYAYHSTLNDSVLHHVQQADGFSLFKALGTRPPLTTS